ncbi:MAG: SAVMC3_10250 family protein [Ilumatobacteraceae bacterium]
MALFGRDSQPTVRDFLYVSAAKVDALIQQMSPKMLKRIAAEVKVDFKLLGVTLKSTPVSTDGTISKLLVVEKHLERAGMIGTVADGSNYFRASLPMTYGWLDVGTAEETSPVVMFRGVTDRFVISLFGSRRHVTGDDPFGKGKPWSALPNILAVISEHVVDLSDHAQFVRGVRDGTIIEASEDAAAVLDDPVIGINDTATLWLNGPTQDLEFVAVRLAEADLAGRPDPESGLNVPDDTERIVLATPLYVARAADGSNSEG